LKTIDVMSAEKLRGGFYSPPTLVRACLDRIATLIVEAPGSGDGAPLRVFEPSAGDGAFIRGLRDHVIADRVKEVTAVEISPQEAAKSRQALAGTPFDGTVITGSVLNGARPAPGRYDVAVGNPPFVRFQFLTEEDRAGALDVARDGGLTLAGVSNLWIPVLLAALTGLRAGGSFAFIVPAECFTGISARSVRTWLIRNADALRADLFPPGSFPSVLQEVVVLSGRLDRCRAHRAAAPLTVVEHLPGHPLSWTHEVLESAPTWTRYLLTPAQLSALHQLMDLPEFHPLAEVARLTVSTVTGANEYFSVGDGALSRYRLETWALPLLPRIRHATGLCFSQQDHRELARQDCPRWLLNFGPGEPDPEQVPAAASYLRYGEQLDLHHRYKCRIRDPWYRVPVVQPGSLLLSKRSHKYPRLVLNSAGAVTTDTIYQGRMTPAFGGREADLVAGFHNTGTLLTAEIEGRSFGGGVLELVPTEIGRVAVPMLPAFGQSLARLDKVARSARPDSAELVQRTDALLAQAIPKLTPDLLGELREARAALLQRRLDRT
jgi:adenine-specific DNA-methyltransferase